MTVHLSEIGTSRGRGSRMGGEALIVSGRREGEGRNATTSVFRLALSSHENCSGFELGDRHRARAIGWGLWINVGDRDAVTTISGRVGAYRQCRGSRLQDGVGCMGHKA